ncbi:CDP-alcohol phosphatidyltransferase family protein [Qipengyuania atrilutea]|uniref:Phosphatidylcholine/phosphatidylserine synthase n=1 Tax=Qipengyuania atrilutea TaxID=2744473 RepID=A0A850H271_9SPHN|nr:phosphatidylcholine/phosphatidylserine synthase [Actirhodobacter atriluteus]NVD44312.1 phosphatidylcholine/phosphatidylserine synthase [Actirhodobacter atriluteus]
MNAGDPNPRGGVHAGKLRSTRVGPKATEDEEPGEGGPRSLSLRALLPNAITAAALCSGLTGIRFAIGSEWSSAIFAVIIAGLLDGIDGRIARLLKAQTRFGAEMDSLADSLSFGMAPALIIYLWSLEQVPRLGWFAALAFAICCALRLARFNAQIDVDEQPHKSAGFLTGVPAPVGAGLAFLPFYLWMATGWEEFRDPILMGLWLTLIAFMMISNIATLSWTSIRPRRNIRLEMIALVGIFFAALLAEPWWALVAICVIYLALMPYGFVKYARIKRQRAAARSAPAAAGPVSAAPDEVE